uniref:Uncharacterized protein n=1 Tax=Odontella aurita TaxID=265563 RepID=A0A7S4JC63_9STRA
MSNHKTMATRNYVHLLILIPLYLSMDGVAALCVGSNESKRGSPLEYRFRSVAVTAAISIQFAGAILFGHNPAIAAEPNVDWASLSRVPVSVDGAYSSPHNDEQAFQKLGLRPPTEDKPQIKFSGSGRPNVIPQQPGVSSILPNKPDTRSPIVIGALIICQICCKNVRYQYRLTLPNRFIL